MEIYKLRILTMLQYELILSTFRNSDSLSTRSDALMSLGSSIDPELIQKTIALARSNEIQSSNDKNNIFRTLQNHPGGVNAIWKWMTINWQTLANQPSWINSWWMIHICTSGFSTFEQLNEVEKFFENKDITVSFSLYLSYVQSI